MIVRYRASDTADMIWFQGQVVTMDDHEQGIGYRQR